MSGGESQGLFCEIALTHVLLLNASYEPLRLITVRRAVNLELSGKVQAVEGIAARLRTPRTVFEVPAVLSLKYYVNVPRRGVAYSRRAVLRRDGWTCVYCGAQPGDRRRGRALVKADFTVDHVVPRSRGGRSTARLSSRRSLDQHRLRLLRLQPAQGRPDAARGRDGAALRAASAAHQLPGVRRRDAASVAQVRRGLTGTSSPWHLDTLGAFWFRSHKVRVNPK